MTKGEGTKGTEAEWMPGIPDLIRDQNDTVPLQSRKSSEARAMIGLLAFDRKSATIREVGNVFNRDDSTIRFAVHLLRRRLKECEGLQNQSIVQTFLCEFISH